jgi:CheY-like chemotaxis protein
MTAGKPKSVLVIESPSEDRRVIGDFLYALGYEVEYADRGNDGLRAFSRSAPDLVVVEVLLSGINGLAVCKMIKDQAAWAKVVVVSKLYQSSGMRQDARAKWKADAYIEKPFELHELKDAVFALIGEPETGGDAPARRQPRVEEAAPSPPSPSPPPVAAPPSRPKPAPAPPPPPAAPPAATAPAPEVEIAGVFDPSSLADLLHRLARERRSGVLRLTAGDLGKLVYVVEGEIVFVKSNLRGESLGSLLVGAGKISEDQYRAALDEMKRTGKKLGTVLVAGKALSAEDLSDFITRQTTAKLVGVFGWEGGEYFFDEKPAHQVDAPRFPARVADVVLAAFDASVDDEGLAARLAEDAARTASYAADFRDVGFAWSDAERAVLDRAPAGVRVGDLAAACGLDERAVARALYRLLSVRAIRLDAPRDTPAPTAAATDEDDLEPASGPPNPGADGDALLEEVRELAARLPDLDDYAVLGCAADDPAPKIKEAYRRLSERYAASALPGSAGSRDLDRAETVRRRLRRAMESIRAARGRPPRAPDAAEAAESDAFGVTPADRQDMAEAELLYREGTTLLSERKILEAVLALQRAADLSPQEADYVAALGWAVYKLVTEGPRTVEDAITLVRKALVLNAGSVPAHLTLARIYAAEKNVDAAAKFYRKAAALDPRNEEIARELRALEKSPARPEPAEKKGSLFRKLW